MKSVKKIIFKEAVNQVISNKTLRGMAVKQLDKYLYNNLMNIGKTHLKQEKLDQYAFMTSIVQQVRKNLDKGFIQPAVMRKMASVFVGDNYSPDRHKKLNPVKESYKEKYGDYPPQFITLSPGKGCNLHCVGCYASSDAAKAEKLDFETTRRIVREAHDIFGSRFMVISGGEPFMYRADGKTILDLFEEFNDMFFLVYTNGTLITEGLAKKLAELGNVTPAISVEGWEEQTDERRGKGVYHRIMKAMENLRKAGVPFGISVTATSKNVDILLQDEFYEHFFNDLGVTYMWQFQLMPIGRGKDVTELMITPEQRVKLYHQWTHLLEDKRFPIADFWNSASLSSGCIAYGRWNGYFYIDWNGNMMPCVFVPYYVDNVKDLFAQGKTLADGLQSKLFKNGRQWQKDYGFENPDHRGNVLMPCSIRDHYKNFKENILTPDVKGEDEEAEAVLHDPEYEKMLIAFDEELQKLTQSIFEEKYLEKQPEPSLA
ncbi:radical SAM protein [Candidatus Sulfidibacterium hydrothermale]|uniref:radical SAM/SPASM domain-containing protein n=1 Tax=Candidatus Sulfidibacterium hydrothermale TaxID=2875962 RepID=UPI001F0B3D1C|nr:radical SAM/SPASM domain-containing protein [Candidatus Sulfidibacterium hydrothermale]UBM62394.1 radical SAM protein [Candidatus Sulfidibacterium hydrothermale]